MKTFQETFGGEPEIGRLYRLGGRNLRAGVWNGDNFIGLRDKFGLRLDSCETEYTIRRIEATEFVLPRSIGLAEYFSRCGVCRRPYVRILTPSGHFTGWVHVDMSEVDVPGFGHDDLPEPHEVEPRAEQNVELFVWLLERERELFLTTDTQEAKVGP